MDVWRKWDFHEGLEIDQSASLPPGEAMLKKTYRAHFRFVGVNT